MLLPRPSLSLTGEHMSEEALESCSARLGMTRSDMEGWCRRTIFENESGGREAMMRPPACTVWYTSVGSTASSATAAGATAAAEGSPRSEGLERDFLRGWRRAAAAWG